MDYDADGILDFISGSYDPGDLYLFRGLGDGRYAAVEKIFDRAGIPLVHHPEEMKEYQAYEDPYDEAAVGVRVASFGSWPAMVDWDADGDLDMLIGSFGGKLFLRLNEGTRADPAFAEESIPVHADGQPLDVGGHANPVVADWTEDDLWDLVVGAHDGSVSLYENTGTAESPRLGPRQILVEAKSGNKFLKQYLEPGEAPKPAVRAQICVTDYDHDGRLDLIVGDYSDVQPLRALTAEERRRVDELTARAATLTQSRAMGPDAEGAAQAQAEYEKIMAAMAEYQDADQGTRLMSSVWLYLRRARTE